MANRPNCLSCPPRRFLVERTAKSAKKRSRDLSEMEVVEVDTSKKKGLKIHFVGFSEREQYDD